MQEFTLQSFLILIVAGGSIVGGIVYWLMDNVAWFKARPPLEKRVWAFALSAALPIAAWLVMLVMGYEAAPTTWQGWIEKVFTLALTPILVSQGIHGVRDLRTKP